MEEEEFGVLEEQKIKVQFELGEDGMLKIVENIQSSEEFKRQVCYPYFKDIYNDLKSHSDQPDKGINKNSFLDFIDLHGLLGERFFKIFDLNEDGYIDKQEFLNGMYKLYYSDFNVKMQFIFDIYDFNLDGRISSEDIKTILCQLPLKQIEGKFTKDGGGGEIFLDRLQSMEEVVKMADFYMKGQSTIGFSRFRNIIEEESSDMFLSIFMVIKQKLPAYDQFRQYEKRFKQRIEASPGGTYTPTNWKLASPKYLSKCSPLASMIRDSPFAKPKELVKGQGFTDAAKGLEKYVHGSLKIEQAGSKVDIPEIEGFGEGEDIGGENSPRNIPNLIYHQNQIGMVSQQQRKTGGKKGPLRVTGGIVGEAKDSNPGTPLDPECIRLANKTKVSAFSMLPRNPTDEYISENEEDKELTDIICSPTEFLIESNPWDKAGFKYSNKEEEGKETLIFCECGSICEQGARKCVGCCMKETNITAKGFLYVKKKAVNRVKKYWYYLLNKELYCYKKPEDEATNHHKRMHILVGSYIKEELEEIMDKRNVLYPFSIYTGKKIRTYYAATMPEKAKWVIAIKEAIGYSNLFDYYEIGKKLGIGKFGIVRAAIHKKTGKQVAVKVMKKKDMSVQDLELVRREIEIMKICQHPNIIRMLDVFENHESIYIVMEILRGGDLFTYLEKRKFEISESRACHIIHQIATAIYYCHQYGVTHRDIKPENILLIDETEDADVKLVDFGLSKIIGPEEKCFEPFGTLSYVAPEVLKKELYSKSVDLWSLGILTFLMLVRHLPFDHENESEIARQTIFDTPDFTSECWLKVSGEGIDFTRKLLIKNKNKRMSINETLTHDWISQHSDNENTSLMREMADTTGKEKFRAFSHHNPESPQLLDDM